MVIWLDNTKIVAVFAVIMVHVADSFLRQFSIETPYWWIANIYNASVRWCVPVFVMVSGALLLHSDKDENLSVFYRKRILRIAIPLIFWSVFFVIPWVVFKALVGNMPLYINVSQLFSGQPYYHLWFLYMMLGLYVMTPIFRVLTRALPRNILCIFTAVGFFLAAVNGYTLGYLDPPFSNWFLMYIPYFFMGYLIREAFYSPPTQLLWFTFLLCVVLTSIGYAYSTTPYFYGYLSLTVIPMSISIMYLLKRWTAPIFTPYITHTLASLSFGIYLVHPIILELIHYHGHASLHFHPALSIPVLAVVVFFFSLAGSWIISVLPLLRKVI